MSPRLLFLKWVLVTAGVLAAIAGSVVLIGSSLPQNHTVARTLRLSASPDTVWSTITDVAGYPSWRRDLDSVQVIQSPSGRTSWREIHGSDKLAFEAETMDRPTHFVARITDKGIPFGGAWDYRIVPDGTGSRLTITENGEVYNPVFRFASKYLIGHSSTIDKYLTYLATRLGETYTPGTAD